MKTLRAPILSLSFATLAAAAGVFSFSACTPAARMARHLSRGDEDFKAGKYEHAKIEYLNVLRSNPNNTVAIERLGAIWQEQGSLLRALPFLLKARDLAPEDLPSRVRLSRLLAALGLLSDARKEACEIEKRDPSNGDALLVISETSLSAENVKDFASRLESFPKHRSTAYLLARATLAMENGDLQAASASVEEALKSDPNSADAHLAMSNVAVRQGDSSRAESELKRAADLSPLRSTNRIRAADFQVQHGETSQAKEELAAILKSAPDYFPAWLLQAQIAFASRQFDEASASLKNVIARDPGNLDALLLSAQIDLSKGETAKGVAELEKLSGTYPNLATIKVHLASAYLEQSDLEKAARVLSEAVSASPDYEEAVLLLAQIEIRQGKAVDAAGLVENFLTAHPGSRKAELLLASAYRAAGRVDDAVKVFRKEVSESPRDPAGWYYLGLVLRAQGNVPGAVDAFSKAANLASNDLNVVDQLVEMDLADKKFDSAMKRLNGVKPPDSAGLKVIQGKIYLAQSDWAHAIDSFREALGKDPNSAPAYESLIVTYITAQQIPKAVSEAEAQVQQRPANVPLLMLLASLYARLEQPEKARECYEKVISLKPDYYPALNNLADLCSERLDQLDKAYALAKRARTLQPGNPQVADTLGWILYKRRDYSGALPLLQEAAAGKLAGNPQVQFHCGMASYMAGDIAGARQSLTLALASPESFPGKAQIKDRLALIAEGASASLSPEKLEELLKQAPDDVHAWKLLGESYAKEGQVEKAIAGFQHALQLSPSLGSVMLDLADLESRQPGSIAAALVTAKKARALAPGDSRTLEILGRIALAAGDLPLAYNTLGEYAAAVSQPKPSTLADFAKAAYLLGRITEARDVMSRVLKSNLEPASSQQAKVFLSLTGSEDPVTAAILSPEAEEVLKTDPQNVPALMTRASELTRKGDRGGAEAVLKGILARHPDFPLAERSLAELYMEQPEKHSEAYNLVTKARKNLPDDSKLSRVLAALSYERKEFAYAVQLLKNSSKSLPLDARDYYILGMSLWQMHDAAFQSALQQAISAGLGEPFRTEANKVLADSAKKKAVPGIVAAE